MRSEMSTVQESQTKTKKLSNTFQFSVDILVKVSSGSESFCYTNLYTLQ